MRNTCRRISKPRCRHWPARAAIRSNWRRPATTSRVPGSVALASARGNPEQLIQALDLLLQGGADLNVVSVHHHLQRSRGGSPLINAVRANNEKLVTAMVERGANINIRDHDGLTALDHAM